MIALLVDAVVVIASLVWAGGMLVLGAIVAPTVFRSGDPMAPDLMAAVFVRFDYVAIAAVALILTAEAASWILRVSAPARDRYVRLALAVALGVCVAVQAGYLSPSIVSLHQRGAHRGFGPLGAEFERVHHWSELVGKFTVFAAVALAIYVLRSRHRSVSLPPPRDES